MAWTQADLDTIESHIASGIRRVTYADGRTVEYQSADHMLAARKVISSVLTSAEAKANGLVRARLASVKSGF